MRKHIYTLLQSKCAVFISDGIGFMSPMSTRVVPDLPVTRELLFGQLPAVTSSARLHVEQCSRTAIRQYGTLVTHRITGH